MYSITYNICVIFKTGLMIQVKIQIWRAIDLFWLNSQWVSIFILSLDDAKEIGKELGHGAYGVVYEVRVSGLVCAGKTLHEAIIQVHILANDEMITTSCYLFIE